ncbi:phosphatidic acid phosphatase type 2/haloperoxidase [Mrakia frigida]|uniref:phosphatidic acid phosphatase type 2/haloperoxidase n=1 Tax=Mrakia frigida TaxID=29902 RepID=UPI003FCBF9DC
MMGGVLGGSEAGRKGGKGRAQRTTKLPNRRRTFPVSMDLGSWSVATGLEPTPQPMPHPNGHGRTRPKGSTATFAPSPLRPRSGSRSNGSSSQSPSRTSSSSSASSSSNQPKLNGVSLQQQAGRATSSKEGASTLEPFGFFQPYLTSRLPTSSANIARFQKRWRTPVADVYFLWTSMLGATTFFMTFLPAFFFFGFPREGRELLHVLAAGIYFSCLFKDLIQVPRPHLPPVTRLSLEYHALEYGFPSSHATSSTSLVLHAAIFLSRSELPLSTKLPFYAFLTIFWLSIVGGRVYCGMHTIMDITAGSVLGALLSGAAVLWEEKVERWLASGEWHVPVLVILATFIISTNRPSTPIPCPCFGDGIAFVSVVAGACLGRWSSFHLGTPSLEGFTRSGSSAGPDGWVAYVGWALAKYGFGVAIIILYRILAKVVLPYLYAPFLSSSSSSPISCSHSHHDATRPKFDVVPSVVDFGALGDAEGLCEGQEQQQQQERVGKQEGIGRKEGLNGNGQYEHEHWRKGKKESLGKRGEGEVLKEGREVLTKVLVYGGIGLLATHLIPLGFVLSGVGLR